MTKPNTTPLLTIIVAIARNNAIGKDNQLLCKLSSDLKRFKQITTGHSLIMGSATFRSLPAGALPNRRNIVLSTSMTPSDYKDIEVATSIEDALALVKNEKEVFIIGGGVVYREMLPLAGKLLITRIDNDYEADTFFPEIDHKHWQLHQCERITDDAQAEFDYSYETYLRVY